MLNDPNRISAIELSQVLRKVDNLDNEYDKRIRGNAHRVVSALEEGSKSQRQLMVAYSGGSVKSSTFIRFREHLGLGVQFSATMPGFLFGDQVSRLNVLIGHPTDFVKSSSKLIGSLYLVDSVGHKTCLYQSYLSGSGVTASGSSCATLSLQRVPDTRDVFVADLTPIFRDILDQWLKEHDGDIPMYYLMKQSGIMTAPIYDQAYEWLDRSLEQFHQSLQNASMIIEVADP